VGLNRKGRKELLAVEEGYRESFQSWRDVLRSLKSRGARWIGLLIADGIDSLTKAVRQVFPMAKRQRCFVHKMQNVLDKVPDKVQPEVLTALREIYHARPGTKRWLSGLSSFNAMARIIRKPCGRCWKPGISSSLILTSRQLTGAVSSRPT